MSSFTELFMQMAHACLLKSQDARTKLADQSPRSADGELQLMALKGDLMNELGSELDALFFKAAENAVSGTFIDAFKHLGDDAVGMLAATVDDYYVSPIHAAIGEWEADEQAGWNDRSADEARDFWR